MMQDQPSEYPKVVARVIPGVCGFVCIISATRINARTIALEISDTECRQIKQLSGQLTQMDLKELFMPLTKNPVYREAERAGCHPSCAIPCAVLKAAEVAMEMALPREVRITFEPDSDAAP
ncbi:MAG: hypothetical protein HKM93_18985 [Desulfobacteraceae bacterium]|nr:hypothetical protein [Desulfobacteraceae bacterium]